jgi:hypothetical protein
MADSMLTVDMVSVGLLLSDGNIDISLGILFNKVEDFQIRNQKYYGTSVDDYRGALIQLCYFELRLVQDFDQVYMLKFKDVILEMLQFNNVYYNDEGESWHTEENHDESSIWDCFKMDIGTYNSKMKLRAMMMDFFRNCMLEPKLLSQVKHFMIYTGITEQLMRDIPYKNYY